mmetsp:Transcript_117659/g.327615  ORF Transcript_117659/g.327615 Transcript_117659/m.327615 type:complete len:289 (-) Transcript_117659:89-955(-)
MRGTSASRSVGGRFRSSAEPSALRSLPALLAVDTTDLMDRLSSKMLEHDASDMVIAASEPKPSPGTSRPASLGAVAAARHLGSATSCSCMLRRRRRTRIGESGAPGSPMDILTAGRRGLVGLPGRPWAMGSASRPSSTAEAESAQLASVGALSTPVMLLAPKRYVDMLTESFVGEGPGASGAWLGSAGSSPLLSGLSGSWPSRCSICSWEKLLCFMSLRTRLLKEVPIPVALSGVSRRTMLCVSTSQPSDDFGGASCCFAPSGSSSIQVLTCTLGFSSELKEQDFRMS